jgi:hypothetical protein
MSYFFFMFTYIISGIIMTLISSNYRALPGPKFTSRQRVDYLTRIIAIIHAIIVTLASYYSCFHLCPIFGTDDSCRLYSLNYHAIFCILSIGYLFFDLSATIMFNHNSNTLTYQTYAHHIAGILAFYLALIVRP